MTQRLTDLASEWQVVIDESFETASSVVAIGRRGAEPVVLKLVKAPNDEWNAGEVLHAFGGRGIVRVLRYQPGAMLLERLQPGTSLVDWPAAGRDTDATHVLVDVIAALTTEAPLPACPTVAELGLAFDRYAARTQQPLPRELVARAHEVYQRLVESQTSQRLLHGDLQHFNVLFDAKRGWVAIDPKGIIGEREFEIGAVLRNPVHRPEIFTSPRVIEARVRIFAERLQMDPDRCIAWGFAQAVLSAVWSIEDGFVGEQSWGSPVRLAETMLPMVHIP